MSEQAIVIMYITKVINTRRIYFITQKSIVIKVFNARKIYLYLRT